MESEIQAVKTEHRFDDYLISLLGGLFIGATIWAILFAIVAIIQAATTPPGINVLDVITAVKLDPPPGIDLSQITILIPLQESAIIDAVFFAIPILIGLVVGWIGYRKILKLD